MATSGTTTNQWRYSLVERILKVRILTEHNNDQQNPMATLSWSRFTNIFSITSLVEIPRDLLWEVVNGLLSQARLIFFFKLGIERDVVSCLYEIASNKMALSVVFFLESHACLLFLRARATTKINLYFSHMLSPSFLC